MRKSTKLMSGLGVVAGLGVALAPLSTFAANTDVTIGTDTLNVTVLQACNLTPRSGNSTYQAWDNEYSTTVAPGATWTITTDNTTHANQVEINCNAGARYGVSATGEVLTKGSDTLPSYGVKFNGGSNYTPLSTTDTTLVATTVISSSPVTFTVDGYQGTAGANQAAGTYTGDVVYTVHFLDAE